MDKQVHFLIYKSADEDVSVNAIVRDESVWLTQKGMAELFGVKPPAVNKHLENIYAEGELQREPTISKMEIVQKEGTRRYEILKDKGKVSKQQAKTKAEAEYDIFNKTQKINSDFDKDIQKMLESEAATIEPIAKNDGRRRKR